MGTKRDLDGQMTHESGSEWIERPAGPSGDTGLDELDEAPGITPKSRLACQTVPDGTTDIVVEIPEWNKNYARELDH